MPIIVQHQLAFARPLAMRVRSVRRPFRPSRGQGRGRYRLPHDVSDRLTLALTPFRNREAAFTLATFLAGYHSNSDRVLGVFAIDRRALVGHADLDLTEKRIRSAVTTLEAVGFLDRAILPSGSRYKATKDGLHRRPIQFTFGSEYGSMFVSANKRARRLKGSDPAARRPIFPSSGARPSTGLPKASQPSPTKWPKDSSEADKALYLGPLKKEVGLPPSPSAPNPLDAALDRLRRAIGLAEGGGQTHGARS
jgi:hypothetical protein